MAKVTKSIRFEQNTIDKIENFNGEDFTNKLIKMVNNYEELTKQVDNLKSILKDQDKEILFQKEVIKKILKIEL